MPSWIYFCACSIERSCVDKTYKNILIFSVFILVLESIFSIVYLTSLHHFFDAHRVCKQLILSFQALQTFFCKYFSSRPLQKNNGPSLITTNRNLVLHMAPLEKAKNQSDHFLTFREKSRGFHTRLSTVNHRRSFSDFS